MKKGLCATLFFTLSGCGGPSVSGANVDPATANSLKSQTVSSLRAEFERKDTNHRGYLLPADLPFLSKAEFAELDRNSDGKITFDEGLSSADAAAFAANAERLPQPDLAGSHALSTFTVGAAAASRRHPVFLIPGYFELAAIWIPFEYRLRSEGWTAIYTMEHWPSFHDIRTYAAEARARIAQIKEETGDDQVDVVGHSLGGLILRYWIERMEGAPWVAHYLSFATPHLGTYDAYLGPGESARQMEVGSDFLKDLNSGPLEPSPGHFAALWSRTDEIVIPAENGQLPGASNTAYPICEHLALTWLPQAMDQAIKELSSR